jgi:hypothetical protein
MTFMFIVGRVCGGVALGIAGGVVLAGGFLGAIVVLT